MRCDERKIDKKTLQEVLDCIASARHEVPFGQVYALVSKLKNLPSVDADDASDG